jgi:hypothetical protein
MAASLYSERRWSALHIAAHLGSESMIKLLTRKGGNVAGVDSRRLTALQVALECSHPVTTLVLLINSRSLCKRELAAVSSLQSVPVKEDNYTAIQHVVEYGTLHTVGSRSPGTAMSTSIASETGLLTVERSREVSTLPSSLCYTCSLDLIDMTTLSHERLNSLCRLCRLLRDCFKSVERHNHRSRDLTGLSYIDVGEAPDSHLQITFKQFIYTNLMRTQKRRYPHRDSLLISFRAM